MNYHLMKNLFKSLIVLITLFFLSCSAPKAIVVSGFKINPIDVKVDSILKLMTLEEKVGQMNQYNGFWDITGPTPKDGQAAKKYADLKSGRVGAMLNVKGVKEIRAIQKIAVEQSRLGIPLLFGFDVIHGYKTISPIPLAEAASWDLQAIKNSASMAAEEASSVGINWTFAPMVDVARDARVSLGYLSEVERGQKEASSELLNAICTALGLSLSGVFAQVASELKSREGVTLTVVDAA